MKSTTTHPPQEHALSASDTDESLPRPARPSWLQLVSNLFFVLGSVLYLVMGISDLQWSRTLQDLPMYVRTADDDTVWVNYRLEERYNASLLLTGGEEEEEEKEEQMEAKGEKNLNSTRKLQLEQYLAHTFASAEETPAPTETLYDGDSGTDDVPSLIDSLFVPGDNTTTDSNKNNITTDETETEQPANPTSTTPDPTATTPALTTTAPFAQDTDSATVSPTDPSTTDEVGELVLAPDSIYYDEWWADLPLEIQTAYATLGYNETIWNEGLAVEADDLDWEALTVEQQAAASSLGYTQESWDTDVATGMPTAEGVNLGEVVDNLDVAVETTGSSPPTTTVPEATIQPTASNAVDEPDVVVETTGSSPPTTTVPEATNLPTASNAETDAPVTTTDPPVEIATSPPTSGASITPTTYEDYDWVELPPEAQEAAIVLGYDERLWNIGGVAESDDYWWRELSAEQQEAAATLGYGEYSWDGTENPNPPPPPVDGAGDSNSTATTSSTTAITSSSNTDGDDYVSYDDDYLFQVGNSDTWVSRYMVLYFSAALCFVYVGLLDLIREKKIFHVLMIFAGANGVVSAMLVEKDVFLSNVFNALSVHFFLLEALTLFTAHRHHRVGGVPGDFPMKAAMEKGMDFGDILFLIGSVIDVFLSYFWLLDDTADWDSRLMGISIFGATAWLLCALIYISGTLYLFAVGKKNDSSEEDDLMDEEGGYEESSGERKSMAIPTNINVATERTEFDRDEVDIEVEGSKLTPNSVRRKQSDVSC